MRDRGRQVSGAANRRTVGPDASRVVCQAGTRPNVSTASAAVVVAKANTRQSKRTSTARASSPGTGGSIATTSPAAHRASTRPAPAPTRVSSRLSVTSCRTSRPRPAPNARRTPISCPRAVDRASSRLARLKQAASRARVTSPSSGNTNGAIAPNTGDRPVVGYVVIVRKKWRSGSAAEKRSRNVATSAATAAPVASAARRAITCNECSSSPAVFTGIQRSTPRGVRTPLKPGGATPTTSNVRPLS